MPFVQKFQGYYCYVKDGSESKLRYFRFDDIIDIKRKPSDRQTPLITTTDGTVYEVDRKSGGMHRFEDFIASAQRIGERAYVPEPDEDESTAPHVVYIDDAGGIDAATWFDVDEIFYSASQIKRKPNK